MKSMWNKISIEIAFLLPEIPISKAQKRNKLVWSKPNNANSQTKQREAFQWYTAFDKSKQREAKHGCYIYAPT